jgi:hypothetical protein
MAIIGDLLTALGIAIAARRFGSRRSALQAVGIWLCCAPSTIALTSATNDWIVSALLAFVCVAVLRPGWRGALLAGAGWAKFGPLAAVPSLAVIGRERTRPTVLAYLGAGFGVTAVALLIALKQKNGIHEFWNATFHKQADRDPVNSLWGMLGLPEWMITVAAIATVASLALLFIRLRRPTAAHALAATTFALIVIQFPLRAWWFVYIVWLLPPLIVLLCRELDDPAVDAQEAVTTDTAVSES